MDERMDEDRRFELPEGLSPEEERAIITALERYLVQDSPHPGAWVLAGRLDATGSGTLQARRYMDAPWGWTARHPFARRGVPPFHGRGDAA
jgi:hypothetical protein